MITCNNKFDRISCRYDNQLSRYTQSSAVIIAEEAIQRQFSTFEGKSVGTEAPHAR